MLGAAIQTTRFVRRTALNKGEYRKNFRQIDRDAIERVTSEEACRVTNLMSKIYLRLLDAPASLRETEGVIRFTGEEREGRWRTAWEQLITLLDVASATAQKALCWMHEQGVIGYDAHRNGVGIRIFINRAASSIGDGEGRVEQKNLRLAPTSKTVAPTSPPDTPFKGTFGVKDNLELNINPPAPKTGAKAHEQFDSTSSTIAGMHVQPYLSQQFFVESASSLEGLVDRLCRELEPRMSAAAVRAASREHGRTREWLEKSGIPKAIRVAQRESYGVLRAYGLVEGKKGGAKFKDVVGRSHSSEWANASADECDAVETAPQKTQASAQKKRLSDVEVLDLAEACVALLKTQGKPIAVTLLELTGEKHNSDGGDGSSSSASSSKDGGHGKSGWLAVTDAERVRALAEELAE